MSRDLKEAKDERISSERTFQIEKITAKKNSMRQGVHGKVLGIAGKQCGYKKVNKDCAVE